MSPTWMVDEAEAPDRSSAIWKKRGSARAEHRERFRNAGRHELPEVVLLVIAVELGERLGRRVRERHAGGRQHEVEVRPPALRVVRRLDRLAGVDLLLGVGLRR